VDLVIKNGTVVTAPENFRSDVGIRRGMVASIGLELDGNEVADAEGRYIFPDAIDPHTHLELDVMDSVSSHDFYRGTVAAACGAPLLTKAEP
jgi:dihydropyrimidinase